ncbi:MAG: DUF1684 domain-containing protein [Promethearchaeota archaeon]
MTEEDWISELEKNRKGKDMYLKYDWNSPIPLKERDAFQGLDYYPIKKEYRLILPLREHKEKKIIDIEDTGGYTRHYIRFGEFVFKIGENEGVLQAYKTSEDDPMLFVPFRDATSGKTTYGAGRYLDLEEGRDQTKDGLWILDFNKAYNPYCAYSDNYVCPFVPIENWLKFPIEAGEKAYKKHH